MKTELENVLKATLRRILVLAGWIIRHTFLDVQVTGAENVPTKQPVIVISNHFSWFDGGLITVLLPFRTAFIVAAESERYWFFRVYMYAFEGIAVHRGRADRTALRTALATLRNGRSIGIFPEGGINPQFAEQRTRGEAIEIPLAEDIKHNASRFDGQLTHPQPGVAFLAVTSGAPILPVAMMGTNQIVANLQRWRRTSVTMAIGPVFGPLTIDERGNKAERRHQLDAHAEEFMHRIAALMPSENQGAYREQSGS